MNEGSHRTYASVGYCIYCGYGDGTARLTDEHIVPYGLYGRLELPNSSCAGCAEITSRFEGYCLRKMFNPIRSVYKIPSRKKTKPRPTSFDIIAVDGRRHVIGTKQVPEADHPSMLFLLQFGPPDILTNREPINMFRETRPWFYLPRTKEQMAKFSQTFGIRSFLGGEFNAQEFSRLLAKIAHAYTVAEFGYGSFSPYLNEAILKGSDTISYWVGGSRKIPPAAHGNAMHFLSLEHVEIPEAVDGRCYVIAKVRLFANMGAPEYWIVVGEQSAMQRENTVT